MDDTILVFKITELVESLDSINSSVEKLTEELIKSVDYLTETIESFKGLL